MRRNSLSPHATGDNIYSKHIFYLISFYTTIPGVSERMQKGFLFLVRRSTRAPIKIILVTVREAAMPRLVASYNSDGTQHQ